MARDLLFHQSGTPRRGETWVRAANGRVVRQHVLGMSDDGQYVRIRSAAKTGQPEWVGLSWFLQAGYRRESNA